MDDNKPNTEGETAFIGFNRDGQVIFDFYQTAKAPVIKLGNNIPAATLKTDVDPSKTYIELVSTPNKVGIAAYRNREKSYEKYKILTSPDTTNYRLINGGSETNFWVIKKDNVDILSANDPLSATVIENRFAI